MFVQLECFLRSIFTRVGFRGGVEGDGLPFRDSLTTMRCLHRIRTLSSVWIAHYG